MEKKIYFVVQDRVRKNIGYKTYEETCIDRTYYREDEIKKAIKHYKKRKANKIIMHYIEYFDDVPYVNDEWCFGDEYYKDVVGGGVKKYIVFKEFNVEYEI